ncbi:Sec-independent protein translocase subunit TatA [Frankia sp. R82]|uniref:Sec-independent protein translocase subunit TatA n=1 Tax=Frankia sp. R82 TaxID=2950553 RepID=UPI0020446900|nr:Sec-independent protein translocase subunit TatA [Frankia sp. R82]MCM3887171.1 Sec-independent protein translocase subunit TatA [Frankia sp. R82]
MADIGVPELLIIVVVIMVLFGAKRLPDAARSFGRSLRIFKSEVKGLHDDDQPAGPTPAPAASPAPVPAPAAVAVPEVPASASAAPVISAPAQPAIITVTPNGGKPSA